MFFLFPYFYILHIFYFLFRARGKGREKSILGFAKFSYYLYECVPLTISPTIMFIIFWDFWWLSKFSVHHKRNKAWLLLINWYIQVVSRVSEWLKSDSGKSQNVIAFLPFTLSPPPPPEMKTLSVLEKIFSKIEIEFFPWCVSVLSMCAWNLEFFSNIFWMANNYRVSRYL